VDKKVSTKFQKSTGSDSKAGLAIHTLDLDWPAADLGMFSMFGQTWGLTKKGPHKGAANFLQHSNVGNNGRYPSERVK